MTPSPGTHGQPNRVQPPPVAHRMCVNTAGIGLPKDFAALRRKQPTVPVAAAKFPHC